MVTSVHVHTVRCTGYFHFIANVNKINGDDDSGRYFWCNNKILLSELFQSSMINRWGVL